MNHNQLLKGTFFLVLAGFISRFIGFFYRIYLSNILGPKNLGLYQLIFPIYSICYTIYASGIQTAISQTVASNMNSRDKKYSPLSPFFTGASLSVFLSFIMSIILYKFAPYIAINLLKEPSCSSSLQILSFVFPYCGLTACINGFYYAIKKTGIPSLSQLIEQIFRVGLVFFLFTILKSNNFGCELAVLGLVFGEFMSCIFMLIALKLNKDFSSNFHINLNIKFYSYRKFIAYTLPLSLNKLIISFLNSLESILIPIMLVRSGLSHNAALSIYGILTGMAMSFIMFPSTITNSLSVILLPTISEASAKHKQNEIAHTVSSTLHYSIIIGLLSLSIFFIFGKNLGITIFHNASAGYFIQTLSLLCPFMYITTTFSSILNGLGKTTITFRNSIISVIIKLFFIIFYIPNVGIKGYLIGILCSTISVCILDLVSLKKYVTIKINILKTIIKPGIILIFTGLIIHKIYNYAISNSKISNIIILFLACLVYVLTYIFILFRKNLTTLIHSNRNNIAK